MKKIEYIKRKSNANMIKIELYFTPILIIFPIIVSILLIQDWFYRGYALDISTYNGELFLGLIILFGNIIFDIPFIKSLKTFIKK